MPRQPAMTEDLTCNCGFKSFSKIIFEDHRCGLSQAENNNNAGLRSRNSWDDARKSDDYSRYDAYSERTAHTASEENMPFETTKEFPEAPSVGEQSADAMPGTWDLDPSFADSTSAFTCICGFSAFSQLLFEDHDCKATMPELVKAAIHATSPTRLKDAGLARHLVRVATEQGPQTVVVKTRDVGQVIWGPTRVEKGTRMSQLRDMVLQAMGQPWASMQLFYEDKELPSELVLTSALPRYASLTAVVTNLALELNARACQFNRFPDIITEIKVGAEPQPDFEAYVESTKAQLREVCGKYRAGCTCISGEILEADSASLLPFIEEKPKGLSCVGYMECLDGDQRSQLDAFLQKAGPTRYWKHDSFGQHYLIAWTAGHTLRMSILSEDGPPARAFDGFWNRGKS
eukprot:gb/GFBE01035711.1/.p1 GENE.gb/GFBE01035711.1/~~gb/GFBE01035711.1/.p1  ORF type:complete len:402 (+),score=84.80 gb/GFBE01035711.1/:1-1206(+)